MTNKETILKAVDFIEKNLKANISVLDMAEESCCSLYHFIRLFQNITGISPKKYLLQRRLTESAYILRDTNRKILDVAFDYQFGSHEAFTRSFRKHFGINPSKIRHDYNMVSLPITMPITQEYIYQSVKARNKPPEVVEMKLRTLVGTSFFIEGETEVDDLSKEWGQFMEQAPFIKNKVFPHRFYQVQYWHQNQDKDGLYFFIGIEVNDIKGTHPQFVVKVIPKGHYLKFIHKGLSGKVGYTYRYIYNEFLPETAYRLTQPFNFEMYSQNYFGPCNEQSESEIFIPIG